MKKSRATRSAFQSKAKNNKRKPFMGQETSPAKEDKFIHRDLSWLAFNRRVLEASCEERYPLFERLKFVAIFANNLDEFFMVRVAFRQRLIDAGYNKKDVFGYYPQDILQECRETVENLIETANNILKGSIAKGLEKNKISILRPEELSAPQKKYVAKFFENNLFPIITPMAIDQGHPFPVIPSKTIAFAVSLSRYDKSYMALIPIPKNIPRLLKLPSEEEETRFILIDEIIRQNLEDFFRGYKILSNCIFRVLRDSEISPEEEFSQDLLKTIEEEVHKRPWAKIIRLEIEKNAEEPLVDSLCAGLDMQKDKIVRTGEILDTTYLFELISQSDKPQLRFPAYTPPKLEYENIFDKIKEKDFITHLPYQSFQPTIDFLRQAAGDPGVLGIKITLYRVDEDSAVIRALKEAAQNKKQVTVLVELKARFDEEKNIRWAKELEHSGCHVIYGLAGMKIHSKMSLVVRKEENKIKRYVHLSTGNYNEKTALIYTDIGYFTANDDFARDISDVFNVITGYSVPGRWRKVVSSPNDLRQYFFELIDTEIENQNKYKNGFIFAKMNSLEDARMIEKLYEASCAGVKVRLIVRGICCLTPGVKNLSENIKVKSTVGRFLEHARVFIFNNNLSKRVYLASSDWMSRNFDSRIELLFEISNEELKTDIEEIMSACWKDTLDSYYLAAEKTYSRAKNEENKF
ncbi:MAG: polyphosphate kinase 1 [Candidatus Omnitrophica bacterium]|nr:polyphosphate kinase 1 [Candidatus Omnitrophota bacterium]